MLQNPLDSLSFMGVFKNSGYFLNPDLPFVKLMIPSKILIIQFTQPTLEVVVLVVVVWIFNLRVESFTKDSFLLELFRSHLTALCPLGFILELVRLHLFSHLILWDGLLSH